MPIPSILGGPYPKLTQSIPSSPRKRSKRSLLREPGESERQSLVEAEDDVSSGLGGVDLDLVTLGRRDPEDLDRVVRTIPILVDTKGRKSGELCDRDLKKCDSTV